MEISAVFETWHLGDGNYPPLHKGQLVNLSFEIEPDTLNRAEENEPRRFHHCGFAEYEFAGSVLRLYREDESTQLAVIETDELRFYIASPLTQCLRCGDYVSGRGTLSLDHYLWVEFLDEYPNAPDLFYSLRVTDICRAHIPERFIVRSGQSLSYPTRVAPDDYGPDDVTYVEAITDEEFVTFIVQFSDAELPSEPIPRTFL